MFLRKGYVCRAPEEGGDAKGAAPAATETPAPATPPPAATAPAAAPPPGDPNWLAPRLEQAKRAALTEAGFASADEAKAAKAALDANKTEAQRQADKLKALEPEAEAAKDLRSRLTKYADAELAKLTEPQKAAVLAIIGEDKTKALDVIEQLRPTWVATPAAPAAGATGGTPPTKPAPATAPGRTAPADASAPSSASKLSQYRELEKTNPFAAAEFMSRNYADIEAERVAGTK